MTMTLDVLVDFVQQSSNRTCKAKRLRTVRDVLRANYHWSEAQINKWLKENQICR